MSDEVSKSPAERRRARLRFRSERRGFKEVDLIFGAFAAEILPGLGDMELDQYEALLEVPDQDVFAWLKNESPVPPRYDTPVFAKLRSLCMRKNPTWNV
jgi:antitoxin CptB